MGECSCGGKLVKGLSVQPNKGDAVLFWSMVCFLMLLAKFVHLYGSFERWSDDSFMGVWGGGWHKLIFGRKCCRCALTYFKHAF